MKQQHPQSAILDLMPGRALRLPRLDGTLTVISGRVWLTCPGDPDDHFLGPGDPWPLQRRSGVVIECEGMAAARVRLPARGRQAVPWLSAGSAACR